MHKRLIEGRIGRCSQGVLAESKGLQGYDIMGGLSEWTEGKGNTVVDRNRIMD